MDKYLGKKLEGRYEISELIGVGGMANVYKAYDVLEHRAVAIKILREEYMNNEEFVRRFRNESKAISVLSHPNIVKVYDVCFSGKLQSIVMEHIDGITLKEYIEQQGILRWKETVHFTVQILRALQHAHDKGIVHRDIKPQNIMLLSDGTIKVTDFGIARFARSETRTITDKAIGSVHYISPEQAQGGVTDEKTDIYSVGVMLFEMLTGKLPFEADTAISVAMKQIQSQALKPREINPSIPEGLEEITIRAMQKDPRKRYQSAAEMLKDFDEFKRNPSILFEYKYMTDSQPPLDTKKYGAAVKKSRVNEIDKNTEIEKRTPIIPVLSGIAAAFVVVCLSFILIMFNLNNPFANTPDITVPDLLGAKYDLVKNSEAYSGKFIIEVEASEFNAEYPKGTIYEQNPKSGKTAKAGQKIKVKVSGGQKIITLPNFEGQDSSESFSKLKELGLEYKLVEIFHQSIPVGSVVATEPGKGSQLTTGDVVTVFVSMGTENKVVEVPSLEGGNVQDARKLLEAQKLELGSISFTQNELPEGTIINQDPAAGSQVSEGTLINVIVSSGNEAVVALRMSFILPDIDKDVSVQAKVDGLVRAEETLNPREVGTWKPRLEGAGKVQVSLLIDGQPYKDYEIDFEEKTSKVLKEYTLNSEAN